MPTDHGTAVVRGRLGAAIKRGDEDAACQAARELARMHRRRRIRDMEDRLADLRRQDES
jgi:hypothetical protein